MARKLLTIGLVIALAGGAVWIGRDYEQQRRRVEELTDDLAALEKQHHRLNLTKQAAESRLHERIDDLLLSLRFEESESRQKSDALGELRTEIRPLRTLVPLLARSDAHVLRVRILPQADGSSLVAIAWAAKSYEERSPHAVSVWRSQPAAVDGDHDLTASQWSLVYTIKLRADNHTALVGPPGRTRVEKTVGDHVWFHTGDATGDGVPDILTSEGAPGTSGCADYRLLTQDSGSLRQVFHRMNCEGGIRPQRGRLRVGFAIYPKGCDYAHGCGRRLSILRWTGSGWVQERKRRLTRYDL